MDANGDWQEGGKTGRGRKGFSHGISRNSTEGTTNGVIREATRRNAKGSQEGGRYEGMIYGAVLLDFKLADIAENDSVFKYRGYRELRLEYREK